MDSGLFSFFKYFPISESMRGWGFFTISAGHSRIPPGYPYPPVQHPCDHDFTWRQGRKLETYTLVYIPNGQGVFESEPSGVLPVRKGNMFVVYPGVWHRYRPESKNGWEEYWIEFSGECAGRFMQRDEFDPARPIFQLRQDEKLFETFVAIVETARHEPYGFQYMLTGMVMTILSLVLSELGEGKIDSEKVKIMNEAKVILMNQYDKNIDIKELAAELNVSYSWFRKAFKDYTGFSPHNYQQEFRLHRARELLLTSDMQIGEISGKLGFSSVYYFSQQFKAKTGSSPLLFRKQNQIKSEE